METLRVWPIVGVGCVTLLMGVARSARSDQIELLKEGDAFFDHRAEGHVGSTADPKEILKAIKAYRKVRKDDPLNIEAQWKLMRSLLFAEHYATADPETKRKFLDEGLAVSQSALNALDQLCQRQLGPGDPFPKERCIPAVKISTGVAEVCYYSGSLWAEWCVRHGAMAAARKGIAGKIRNLAKMTIALDDHVRYGGGYRMLGRLLHKCPHIPLVTGWISKSEVIPNLEKALSVDSHRKFNRFFYAEALYDLKPEKRPEAIAIVRALIAEAPDTDLVVEDLRLQEEASDDLRRWKFSS